MEFKRTAYDELLRWKKESAGKTALLLDGKDVMIRDDVIHLPLYMAMYL